MGFGGNSRSFFGGTGEKQRLQKGEPSSEQARDKADQQRRDNGSLSDSVQTVGKEQGKDSCDDSQRHIKSNLRGTEFRLPCRRNRADKRFTGQHGHVCKDFRINPESENHTSDQEISQ